MFGIAANVMRTNVRKEIARGCLATTLSDQPKVEPAAPRDADVIKFRAAIGARPRSCARS